jgi:HEAT repeat protein
MNPSLARKALLAVGAFAAFAPAQDWTEDQLVAACQGYQTETVVARLEQTGKLLADKQAAFAAIVARIHGDRREYSLKVERLLGELGDPRWQVRENAERTLIEIGSKAYTTITEKTEKFDVLEQQLRCKRILDALKAKGQEAEDRERRLMRGLITAALYLDREPRLLRALRSALGDLESPIPDGAIRALGKFGSDDEVDVLLKMAAEKNGFYRHTVVAALARIDGPKALAACKQLMLGQHAIKPTRTETMAMLRALHSRADAGAKALLQELATHPDPVVAVGTKIEVPAAQAAPKAKFTLGDRATVEGTIVDFFGDSMAVAGAFEGMPIAELPFGDCDTIEFPAHAMLPVTQARVFLNQGSLVLGTVLAIDPEAVRVRSDVFGDLTLARKDVQGIAFDPSIDRLVGASMEHDRVRLKDATFVDGVLQRGDATTLVSKPKDGADKPLPLGDVAGVLFMRPRTTDVDTMTYVRFDLVSGERLIGFLVDASPEHVAVSVPLLGAAVLPWTKIAKVEIGVGGGAMWGFTLIADYSDNRIVEVDDQGRVTFVLEEIFGAWDAECLDNGNLLITEFSVSRVQEVDRKGKSVWVFEDLKNPYDADRLPNGNTLIADTFASRVIEVSKEGKIVWQYAKDIRPFDCDRLANGNTLIADVLKDRIIEVSPEGEIVWELKNMPNAHDADRLPNGNTLVTLRNKGVVLEVDRDGKVVFELTNLSSPSDSDRLPNGNTLVAENTRVREFDRRGNEVWKKDMTWAVEVNRY